MAKQSAQKAATAEQEVAANLAAQETATQNSAPVVEENVTEVTEKVAETVVEDAQVVSPTAEAPASPVIDAPVVEESATAVEEVSKAPVVEETKEKIYSCLALVDHTCSIGGERISIVKDKLYDFPSSVAMVLQGSRKIIVK